MVEREPYRPGLVRNQKLVQQLKELQKNPRSLVFVSLAETYRAESLPHQALEILEDGLAFHPGLASAVLAKARCLFDLRRFGEAAGVCRDILQSNPDNIRAHKLQAEIYVRLGQRRGAIRALTRVVTLFPQDREAVKALEELENLDSASGEIVPTERLGRASVDTPPTLGRIDDFQVGSFSDSLAAISREAAPPREIIETQVFSPVSEAPAAREAKVLPKAETTEDEDGGSEPTFATRTIAELYLRQGLKKKAEKVLRKILQQDPLNAWARETLQELGSDGIVLPAQTPEVPSRRTVLLAKAKVLERLLAQVRLHKARKLS